MSTPSSRPLDRFPAGTSVVPALACASCASTQLASHPGSPQSLATIAAIEHARTPSLVGKIPVHGLGDAGFETFALAPAQFALELARVDRVAPVVTGPVLDVVDKRLPA